jgi:hypothetical protein
MGWLGHAGHCRPVRVSAVDTTGGPRVCRDQGVRCAGGPGTAGVRNARPLEAGADAGVRSSCADLAGLGRAVVRTSLLPPAAEATAARADRRSVRRIAAVADLSAALSTTRCGVSGTAADRTAAAVLGVRDADGAAAGVRTAVDTAGHCRSLRASAAIGGGRRAGVRWWGAATAGTPGRAGAGACRRVRHARRSWLAAPAPTPPRWLAHRAGGP